MEAAEGVGSSGVSHEGNRALHVLLADRDKYLNFLMGRLHDREQAEELLQAVTLKVVERGSQLRFEASARAWLYRILRNAMADHYRATAKTSFAADQDSSGLEIAVPGATPKPCPCATHEIRQLKPEYAEMLRTVEMEGTSVMNYASAHAIGRNAAYVRLHRARKSLRKRIMNTCGSCAGAGCFDCSC